MAALKRRQEEFKFWFDDLYGDIEIAGISFSASDILEQMDPIAFQEEFYSYLDIQKVA